MLLKIGELAKRTGLTVRVLRHYDAVGLLKPSVRSEAGYRLYNRDDVAQLHRIQALRRLNLSLAEVGQVLQTQGVDLKSIIEQQITALNQQLSQVIELRDRLNDLVIMVEKKREPNMKDWLTTLERMSALGKYFSEEEIAGYRQSASPKILPDQRWVDLVGEVRDVMDQNKPVDDPGVKALAKRWTQMVDDTMGDDPRFFLKLDAMHRNEQSLQILSGVDGAMIDYMRLACMEVRFDLYAAYFNEKEIAGARRGHRKNMDRWQVLISDVCEHVAQGLPDDDPQAQALLDRWVELFEESWGSDLGMRLRVAEAHRKEPGILFGSGINGDMLAFIARGFASVDPRKF